MGVQIIRVDRLIRPIYPDWVETVIFPKLEGIGPTRYDLAKVELWFHDDQKRQVTLPGRRIFNYLKKHDMLKTCLGLRDREEIQRKDVVVLGEIFDNNDVYFWKSVVRSREDKLLYVPCLSSSPEFQLQGKALLTWECLSDGWWIDDAAARFSG